MCILGLLLRIHPDIPFVCLHNRDEFLTRPVAPPHRDQAIIYGKDLQGNGTWMGYNTRTGIVVSLTNVRNRVVITPKHALSRGELVLRLLEHAIPLPTAAKDTGSTVGSSSLSSSSSSSSSSSFPAYVTLDQIRTAATTTRLPSGGTLDLGEEYGPCNIVIASLIGQHGKYSDSYVPEAYFLSNCILPNSPPDPISSSSELIAVVDNPIPCSSTNDQPSTNLTIDISSSSTEQSHPTYASRYAIVKRIEPGIHALSNSVLDDENWDKVRYLRQQLQLYTKPENSFPTLQELVQRYQQQKPSVSLSTDDKALEYLNEAEIALVEIVLNQFVPLMTSPEPLPLSDQRSSTGDLSWSPLTGELESKLQQHIFIPHNKVYNYGTRALSIVLQVGKSVYYCYSSFDPEDPVTIDRTQSTIASERIAISLARQINAITNPPILAKGETSGQLHTSIPTADNEGICSTVHSAVATGIGVSNELFELPHTDSTVSIIQNNTDTLQEQNGAKLQKHSFVEVAGIRWIIIRSELSHHFPSA